MMDSWALKAIEREAMERAQRNLSRQTFYYMTDAGPVTQAQIAWLIRDYEQRTGRPAMLINTTSSEQA